MPEDGSVRPRPMRRLLIAIARAVALFILVTGIYGALTIALPQWPLLNRSIGALLIGVTVFEMLRPARRAAVVQTAVEPAVDNSLELEEARNTIQLLRDELERARDREAELRSEFERESEHLQRAASRALEEIQRTRSAHDEARVQLESERGKSAASQQELEALRLDRQRVARELEVARQKLEVDKTKLGDLQREVELTQVTSQKLVQANETLKKQFEEERQRLQAELQRVAGESKTEREKMQGEARAAATRVNELIAQLERERKLSQELGATRARVDEENAALRKAREAAAAENESLRQRLEEIELVHGSARHAAASENESLRQRVEELSRDHAAALETLDTEWGAKLQKIVSELATDHENDLGQAIGDREAARAEVRLLQQQLQSAVKEHERALKQLDDEWSAKLQKIVNGLTADHENDVGEAIAKREEARAEVRALQGKVTTLEHHIEQLKEQLEAQATAPMPAMVDEGALRQKIDEEWSAKLQKIVNGLTADHENDIGDAIAKREEARAEARALQLKVTRLEENIALLKRQVEAQVTMPMPAMVDEKALREKIDSEWSAKLQTIVSHIASDHEADVGKAIEEREAARAEARNMTIKLTALQQKLDAERKSHQSLQSRFRELEDRLRDAPTQPIHALSDPFPVETAPPHEEERARADVLQFAEQAHEAIRRASLPGNVPIPQIGKRARILIVHHDPRFRAMWQDYLEKNGFGVQTAADGLEGLRAVKSDKPDAVIADVAMPKMDGRELCQMIKSNPETADVKVILLSGMYTNDMQSPGEKSAFEPDELLRKPVKLDAMKAALSNLLAEAS